MVDMAALKALCKPEWIAITEHARLRLVERGIAVSDIISCKRPGRSLRSTRTINLFPAV